METLSQRLKKLRNAKGLTISEVSQLTGISASTYKEWEGGRQIRGEPYEKLAHAFEVSVHELITGKKPLQNRSLQLVEELQRMLQELKIELYSSH